MKYIIVSGTPTPNTGMIHIGPFPSAEDAREYLEKSNREKDCWISELIAPFPDLDDIPTVEPDLFDWDSDEIFTGEDTFAPNPAENEIHTLDENWELG